MKKLITMLLLTAGVSVYSQENANQTNSFNIAVDSKNPCQNFIVEVFPNEDDCKRVSLHTFPKEPLLLLGKCLIMVIKKLLMEL